MRKKSETKWETMEQIFWCLCDSCTTNTRFVLFLLPGMALNFYKNLSSDFIKLLENGDEHNVIIEVGESTMMQPFKVHSTVLCYRCPYLYDEFKKSTISNDDNIRIIQKPQISDKFFDIIVKYIYGEKVETSVIFDLLKTANEFQLEELMTRLQIFLIENQSSWLKLNFSKIYNSSFQTNNLKALQNYCNDIIAKHPNLIFESNDFNTLPEAALISIIQRDDLQLEESKVWDYVIQWGISQNKTLPSDVDDWIDKDFQILKNTLQQFLPHIRYFQIFSENIMKKVFPYRQILDKKLWANILKYSMAPNKAITSKILPPRKIIATQLPNHGFQFTSSIVNIEQVTKVASWIDRKDITYEINNNPYEFNLILRGRAETDLILNKSSSKAIYNSSSSPACFSNDLFMSRSQAFCVYRIERYEKLIRESTGSFSIDDYEVFQISERKNI
ncbi:hypothetical protein Glove_13g226 [Diversispora epigaea]|uniref:BTB domain-containing protein n=1 Tax=Diversispora epigaea TaxID=1348612 RepID=A0A397JRT3_9GLOM|nr:hypothetical protein Glove_13g226 [Diversispora epigaea]